jgi:hypothetical protein
LNWSFVWTDRTEKRIIISKIYMMNGTKQTERSLVLYQCRMFDW